MASRMDASIIRQKWDEEALQHKTSKDASWKDPLLLKEIAVISRHLVPEGRILDAGCANGFSTLQYLKRTRVKQIIGMDYASSMIEMANLSRAALAAGDQSRVNFMLGDLLKLETLLEKETFDQVVTKRVITNLCSEDEQMIAAEQIHRVLKPQGIYLCSEPSLEGLASLNGLRKKVNLPLIEQPWHNLYLQEKSFLPRMEKFFILVKRIHFSSTYYAGSRVLYALFSKWFGFKMKHESWMNKLFLALPNFGSGGVQKLFVFQKRNLSGR